MLIKQTQNQQEYVWYESSIKNAKFCIAKDLSVSLCSNCAINIEGKGFVVEEINEFEERQRREVIEQFVNLINRNFTQYDKAQSGLITKIGHFNSDYLYLMCVQFYLQNENCQCYPWTHLTGSNTSENGHSLCESCYGISSDEFLSFSNYQHRYLNNNVCLQLL